METGERGWATTLAVVNQKGGVGKSTTALNLADALAELGYGVLVVDADPQSQISNALGIDSEPGGRATMAEVMTERARLGECIVAAAEQGVGDSRVDVVPSSPELDDFEFALRRQVRREAVLSEAIVGLGGGYYDFVIVDSHPDLRLLEINVMYAADGLIVPVTPEKLPLYATRRLIQAFREVQQVKPQARVLGALLTKVDVRTNLTRSARQTLREQAFGEDGGIFETEIRYNVRLAETPGYSASVLLSAPGSQGAADYRALAQEVIQRVGR